MKAKIKTYHSADIEDLHTFIPSDKENFSFLLELMVGPDNAVGEESFNIQVCTPHWLLSVMKREDVMFCDNIVLVLEYDFNRIFNKIKSRIEACTGDNWSAVAAKVARIGHWEFEDYVDASHDER